MPRQDIFTFIHKGLRSLIYEQGKKLMQTDFADEPSLKKSLDELEHSIKWFEAHGKDEDEYIFPALREFAPVLIDDFIAQHQEIHKYTAELRSLVTSIRQMHSVEDRIQAGIELNRAYNRLAARYLNHMNREESEVLPVTWQYLTDEKIGEMRGNIQRNTAPDVLKEQLTWAIGATNNSELIGLLKGLKASASTVVLENVTKIAQNALPIERWQYVKKAVEL